jgi:hypothetical protein
VLCVGRFPVRKLTQYWESVTYLASIKLPGGVHNGLHGAHIYLCEHPRGSWAAMWPRMRHSSGVPY